MPGNCFNASEASFPFVLFRRCRRVCPLRTNPFVEWNKNSFFFLLKMIAMRMPGLVRQRTHIAFTFLCEYYTTWRGRPWTYDACYNVRTRCRQFSSKISLPDSSLSLEREIYIRAASSVVPPRGALVKWQKNSRIRHSSQALLVSVTLTIRSSVNQHLRVNKKRLAVIWLRTLFARLSAEAYMPDFSLGIWYICIVNVDKDSMSLSQYVVGLSEYEK